MRRFALILFFACGVTIVTAQRKGDNENSLKGVPFKERIVTGGGFGMSFGSSQDYISLSPLLGYKLTQKFIAGTSFTYRYTKFKYYTPSITLMDYGVSPFLRYTIFNNIFVQVEYEYLNYEFPTGPEQSIRQTFNSFIAGGGFIQPISDKAAFYISAMYNFSYVDPLAGQYSPYYSPLILRAGITVGF